MVEYRKHENTFIAYERAPAGTETFRTYAEFERLGKEWNGRTLIDLYNNLASAQGRPCVKKFTNHETGIKRVRSLLKELPVSMPDGLSKKALVLQMVQSPSGSTLDEIMQSTGWQAHSVRGFLSTQRRDYAIARQHRTEDVIAYYAAKKSP